MSEMSWCRSGFAVGGAVSLLGLLGVAVQASPQTEGRVRLLFPVLTGREYGLLKAVAPQATIVEINGATFVQVASFSNEQVAYELGRSIQREIRIPFDLAVTPGGPEATPLQTRPPTATLREGRRDEAGMATTAARSPLPLETAAAARTPAPPNPGVNNVAPAAKTAITTAPPSTPSQVGRSSPEIILPTQPATLERDPIPDATPAAIANIRVAAAPAVPPQAKAPNPKQAQAGDASPAPAIRSNATEPPPERTTPTSVPHSTQPASSSAGAIPPQELTEPTPATVIADYIAGREQAAATPTTAPSVRTETDRTTRSHADARRGTVPIAAVTLGLPVIRSEPAPNRGIDYLFVRVRQPADMQKLIRITQVGDVFAAGETLLVRVGVFTRSSKGQQLLHGRIGGLRHHQLELLVARGGEPQAIS
jgi:hypothetical protein